MDLGIDNIEGKKSAPGQIAKGALFVYLIHVVYIKFL